MTGAGTVATDASASVSVPYVERAAAQAAGATLPRLFADWVAEYGPEPALSSRVDGRFTPITYNELDRRASLLALALARRVGVRRGELVALICDNRPEWLVCSLAIHFLGAVDVPRATETPEEILEAILRHAEPAVVILEDPAQLPLVRGAVPGLRAVVLIDAPDDGRESLGADGSSLAGASGATPVATDLAPPVVCTLAELMALGEAAWPEAAAVVRRRREEVSPDDLATVIYTSGTTGTPKGVALTHANYELNLRELPKTGRDRARAGAHPPRALARLRAADAAHVPQQGLLSALQQRDDAARRPDDGAPRRHGHRAGAVGHAVQGRLPQDRGAEAGPAAAGALAGRALADVGAGAARTHRARARRAAARQAPAVGGLHVGARQGGRPGALPRARRPPRLPSGPRRARRSAALPRRRRRTSARQGRRVLRRRRHAPTWRATA